MSARREVRVDPRFFEQLDARLGSDRGPLGEPSATDFLLADLPPIADTFAEHFDVLIAPIPDRDDYRIVIAAGRMVAGVAVIGQLVGDTVVLIGIELDLDAGW